MSGLTTVTTKGQITIPESVRKLLGVKIGDKAYFGQVFPKEKKVVIKIVPKNIADRLFGSLKTDKRYVSLEKVRDESAKIIVKKYSFK